MGEMGGSGKTAVGAMIVALALLALTATTLAEPVLVSLLASLAVGYVACLAEIFSRRRRLVLALAGIGTSLAIGFSVAFLRTWGLAFNPGAAMATIAGADDSDAFFYLAAASGAATLLVLFAGILWPGRKGAGRQGPGRRGAGRKGRPGQRPSTGRRPAPRRTGSAVSGGVRLRKDPVRGEPARQAPVRKPKAKASSRS
jgi:hypothetical protein